MRAYLAHGRRQAFAIIAALTPEDARRVCTFRWGSPTFAELLVYNLRHVQHGVGQLNLLLRHVVNTAPRWVVRAP